MSHLNFHPAPGLSDLAPGWFIVPQNPVAASTDSTELVATMAATAPGRIVRNPALADLVRAAFVVPENPIVQNLQMGMAGMRGMGCPGFGCDGGRQYYSLNGLAAPGTDPVSQWLATNGGQPGAWLADETTFMSFSLPMWGWIAGGFAAAYVASDLFSRGRSKSKEYARRYANA